MIVRTKGRLGVRLLGVASVWLLLAGGQRLAAAPAPLDRDEVLKRASDAVKANARLIRSGAGVFTFEVHAKEPEVEELRLISKGRANVYFDGGKYHFRVKYETRLVKVGVVGRPGVTVADWKPDDLAIIDDGEKTQVVTWSKAIRPTGCEIEVFPGRESSTHSSMAEPTRHLLGYLGLEEQLRGSKRDAIRITDLGTGVWRVGFEPKVAPGGKLEIELSSEAGYNPTRYRLLLPGQSDPFQEYSARWKKAGDVYYVERLVMDFGVHRKGKTGHRLVFQYQSFEPNAKVDPKLFTLDCLTILPGTRTLDHRPQGKR
jgi:hypothetical protein